MRRTLCLGLHLPLAALLLLAPMSAARAQDCGSGHTWQAQGGGYRVGFSVKPAAAAVPARAPAAALVVGQHFQLELQLCAAPDSAPVRTLRVDADMPAHRHGMNYRSSVQALGANQWQAAGLMFHMPGRWRFIIDLDTPHGTQRLTREVEVL